MKELLEKLKLIEYMTTEIEMQKGEFAKKFMESVDEGSIDFLSSAFDIFSSSENEYKGHVGFNDFKIKRRNRIFDINTTLVVAKGTYGSKGDNVIIETEINGFSNIMIPYYLFTIIFYLIFVVMIFFVKDSGNIAMILAIPLLMLHALLMLGFPYLIMRRGAKRMKYELGRDFFYMTKK